MSKQDLDKQREQIDKIDAEIVQSLNQRLAIAHEIGKIKQESGSDFYDPAREADCLLYTSPSPRDTNPSRMPSSA